MTLKLDKVNRGPHLSTLVASSISREIAQGRLKPGDQLPTEQALATTFGVSRNVVREAIARLRSEGRIWSQQGRGAFVVESNNPTVLTIDYEALQRAACLEDALANGIATEAEIESYEVSVAIGGRAITYSTRPGRSGQVIGAGNFSICADGLVAQEGTIGGQPCVLFYEVDVFEPEFRFEIQTPSTSEALDWLELEKPHLARHATLVN